MAGTSQNIADVRRSRAAFSPATVDKVPVRPLRVHPEISVAVSNGIRRHRNYTAHMISSQETAIEHLRHVRKQMEKDELELKKIQDNLNVWMYPKKWTPYNSATGIGPAHS